MNIAIIPARAGSTRIPNKNVRLFHGKPIMAYSIETARKSRLFEDIIVSTDSQDYAKVAKAYGAKVHMRSKSLSVNEIGTQEVALHAVDWWRYTSNTNRLPEYACCIYATSPLMSVQNLTNAYAMLVNTPTARFVYSVGPDGNDAGQFYWGDGTAFYDALPLDVKNPARYVYRFPIEAARVCDINVEADWQRAERMYADLQERGIEQEAVK